MNNHLTKLYALSVFLLILTFPVLNTAQDAGKQITRTKTMSKSAPFGPGGTITITGAPVGSITVEGWDQHKVSIEAEIEVRGATEEDAARIAAVTGFVVDEDVTSFRITSVGSHDKKYLKKVDKKFPKKLKDNFFSINYKIMVPQFSDLQIDGGNGGFDLSNVEGSIFVNYLESDAKLRLVGGNIRVVVGTGSIDCVIATRSWRGKQADIQLKSGDIKLRLPKNLNLDLEARILRSGKITDEYLAFAPKPRTEFTGNFMSARTGSGGAVLALTIGDGNLSILDFEKKDAVASGVRN